MKAFVSLAALLACSSASGGDGVWTHIGPWQGASELSFGNNPPTLYGANLTAGVFRTTDGAQTWTQAADGYPGCSGQYPSHLAADAGSSGALYLVAPDSSRICKSTNGGANWTILPVGAPGSTIQSLVSSHTVSGLLYAVITDVPNTFTLLKSTDAGASWTDISSELGQVFEVFESFRTSQILFGLVDDGLLRTSDGGTTWAPFPVSLPIGLALGGVALDPSDDARVFVLAYDPLATRAPQVGSTRDGGGSWTFSEISGADSSDFFFVFAVASHDPSLVFAGSFRSTDGGRTWSRFGPDAWGFVLAIAFDPSSPAIYVAASPGVFRSPDSGATWQQASRGFPSPAISKLALSRSSALVLYALDYGPYRTTDGGENWTNASLGLPGQFGVQDIVVDPEDPLTVYVNPVYDGIYKSTDGGEHWARTLLGGGFRVDAFALDPAAPSTLYAALQTTGLVKSTDGGETFGAIVPVPGFLFSTVSIDPTDPRVVYAGLRGTEFFTRSTDAGASFQNVSSPVHSPPAPIFDPRTHGTFYVYGGGVFRTINGGATWTNVSPSISVRTLVLDPTRPATLYAGTFEGIFRSEDAGQHWIPFNDGLDTLDVRALAISSSGSRIYAGTVQGVYVYDTPFERIRIVRERDTRTVPRP